MQPSAAAPAGGHAAASLPDDLLVFIFKWLHRRSDLCAARLTCKSWAAAGNLVPYCIQPKSAEFYRGVSKYTGLRGMYISSAAASGGTAALLAALDFFAMAPMIEYLDFDTTDLKLRSNSVLARLRRRLMGALQGRSRVCLQPQTNGAATTAARSELQYSDLSSKLRTALPALQHLTLLRWRGCNTICTLSCTDLTKLDLRLKAPPPGHPLLDLQGLGFLPRLAVLNLAFASGFVESLSWLSTLPELRSLHFLSPLPGACDRDTNPSLMAELSSATQVKYLKYSSEFYDFNDVTMPVAFDGLRVQRLTVYSDSFDEDVPALGAAGFAAYGMLKHLTSLELSTDPHPLPDIAAVLPGTLAALSRLQAFTFVDYSGLCLVATTPLVEALASLPQLRDLHVSTEGGDAGMSREGWAAMAMPGAFAKLTYLAFEAEYPFEDEPPTADCTTQASLVTSALGNITALASLKVHPVIVGSRGHGGIALHAHLLGDELSPLTRLRRLKMIDIPASPELAFLRVLTALTEVHLRDISACNPHEVEHLAALCDLPFLQTLDMSGDYEHSDTDSPRGFFTAADAALQVVSGCCALHWLAVDAVLGLTDTGLQALHGCSALKHLTLTSLNGSSPAYTARGLAALKGALPDCQCRVK